MKAARFHGGTDMRIATVPDPRPGPGEVLIAIGAAGICGSDLHDYRDGPFPGRRYPHGGGHELAGTVVELGPDVMRLQVGDRVGVEPLHLIGCGACRWCRQGQYEVCPQRGMVDGVRRSSRGFAEMDVAPEGNCYPLPNDLPIEHASILDVYACGVHAAHRAPALPGDTVAVIGTGPIGLAAAEIYRALGAWRVVVCGRTPQALSAARGFAADEVLDTTQVDAVAALHDMTGGRDADIVIEAVGGQAETLGLALELLAPNGTIGILGMFREPQALDVGQAMRVQAKLTWINSYGAWGGISEFRIALEMMAAGRLHPKQMITHRYPLDRIAEGFAAATNKRESGAIKVLITP